MTRARLLDRWKQALERVKGDAKRFVEAHVELAKMEAGEASRTLLRRLVWLAGAASLVLLGLGLLCAGASVLLDGVWGLSTGAWLVVFGGLLLGVGGAVLVVIPRRMRGDGGAFEETRDVLREDAAWLGDALSRAAETVDEGQRGAEREVDAE